MWEHISKCSFSVQCRFHAFVWGCCGAYGWSSLERCCSTGIHPPAKSINSAGKEQQHGLCVYDYFNTELIK